MHLVLKADDKNMIITEHRMTRLLVKHVYELGQVGESTKKSHICTIEDNANFLRIGKLVGV